MADIASQLREFTHQTLALWQAPGAALAVMKGGETLLCEGFGYADLESRRPATEKTLFAIGSCTKAFTTFDLGLLVDEGKLDWDQPLRDFLPGFRLFDEVATAHITPRDLVSHRVGLPRHDLVWYNAPLTRHDIFARLRYLEPNKDIRQVFQYQNLMFLIAGLLVENLSRQAWEAFTRERIFEPLHMTRSNFSVDDSQRADDFALPYHEKKNQIERIPFRNIDSIGPAGSINSSVEDMLAWLRVQSGGGRLGDRQMISPGNLSQMHSPQMIVQEPQRWKELLGSSYGLGWFVQPYRGYEMVWHTGHIDGFSAMTTFLPSEGIGVVALANLGGSTVPNILAYRAFDLLLGLEPVAWNARFLEEHAAFQAGEEASKARSAEDRRAGHPPAHALEEYTGEYEHPGYGNLTIELVDGGLKAVYNNLEFQVEPYHFEIFEFSHDPIDLRLKGTFFTDELGNVSRLSLPFEPNVGEIVFERAPERNLRERAFLERLAGVYEMMGLPLLIALKGADRLVMTLPGQAASELDPYRGTTFLIKDATGCRLTFHLDSGGPAQSVEIIQPGLALTAERKS